MDTTGDALEDDETPFCHLQGYSRRVNRFDGNRNCSNNANRNHGGTDGRYGLRTPRPPPDKPQGRFTQPNQRQRAYKPRVQCDACKRIGHDAVNCDMLAIALYIDKHTKDISDNDRSNIKSCWLEK
jgi:hypothetical protein